MVNDLKICHGGTKYYPHIDGIRALAVIPVVLNHIYAALCPGGFAGVDVFFVISGYLITGRILRDLQNGSFSIAEFYSRRIRRIFPAYFAVMLGVFCVGMAVYYAAPMRDLLDTMLAGTFFASNLYFWVWQGDYFGPAVRNNPLMHLWSLSVEEQFYLFIPLLYAWVWKTGRKLLVPIFAGIALCSFIWAVWTVNQGDVKSAFYLFHLRAWELLAGGLLAMLPVRCALMCRGGVLSSLGAWGGLALVVAAYWGITEKTPFPGVASLASVLGTVLLIYAGGAGVIGRLLSQRHVVWFGKISYSLYLVHWPVIVFWRWLTYDTLFLPDYFGMVFVSILLARCSWRWVEQPVRQSMNWSRQKAFSFVSIGTVLLFLLSFICLFNRCWPERYRSSANNIAGEMNYSKMERWICSSSMQKIGKTIDHIMGTKLEHIMKKHLIELSLKEGHDGLFCFGPEMKDGTLVIGDSHAASLQQGMNQWAIREQCRIIVLSHSATSMFNLRLQKARTIFHVIDNEPSISRIILVQAWVGEAMKETENQIALREFIMRMQILNKKVYIVSDVAGLKDDRWVSRSVLARMEMFAPRFEPPEWDDFLNGQPAERYENMQGNSIRVLSEICNDTGTSLIPLQICFLRDKKYHFSDKGDGKHIALYRDHHHLVGEGSIRATAFIMDYICKHERNE